MYEVLTQIRGVSHFSVKANFQLFKNKSCGGNFKIPRDPEISGRVSCSPLLNSELMCYILVSYCCITNCPKMCSLKTASIYYLRFLFSQESECDLVGHFWLKVFQKSADDIPAWAIFSLEGSTVSVELISA
jgi:hypothetical protein